MFNYRKIISDKKSATATFATALLEDIILERYLINVIPENRQYSLQAIKKLTGYDFLPISNYVSSELFTINKTTIEITENTQLLSDKSKNYCKTLIQKLIFPSNYEQDKFISYIGKLYDSSYYTSEEKNFIELMLDKLFCIINDEITIKYIPRNDLLKFNLVNSNGFCYTARDIYNAILQKKFKVGDNILPFINNKITDKNVIYEKLKCGSKFDCFFTENAILKCDLNTNLNILIKNFLNLIIYNLNDTVTKNILLSKLNSRYPILIKNKIFNDFE
ncbi:MAG: hypothetical protein K2K80_08015 [Clostridia bacterium]|nr:hypothetical protein [Clostridia bacterium]